MEKVFVLCRRTLLNRKTNDWSSWCPLKIYRYSEDADNDCMELRKAVLDNYDDMVDYCVIPFNVIG